MCVHNSGHFSGLCTRVETYPEFNGAQKQEWLTLQNKLEFYEVVS